MADVSVRTARPGDAKAILDVKQTAITELSASAYTQEQIVAWAPSGDALAEYRKATETDSFQVLVACDGEQIIGYGVLNAGESRIEALFVHPSRARSGVGTQLLGQLEVSAMFVGCRELTVISSRNATGFYISNGYAPTKKRSRELNGVKLRFIELFKQMPD